VVPGLYAPPAGGPDVALAASHVFVEQDAAQTTGAEVAEIIPNTPRVALIADATYTTPADVLTTMSFGAEEYTAPPVSAWTVQPFVEALRLEPPAAEAPSANAFNEYVGRSSTASATAWFHVYEASV